MRLFITSGEMEKKKYHHHHNLIFKWHTHIETQPTMDLDYILVDDLVSVCCRRYVHSKNRAGLPFSLALNSLSDRTMSELATMRGRKRGKTPNRGLPFPAKVYEGVEVPDSLDWRLYGTPTHTHIYHI